MSDLLAYGIAGLIWMLWETHRHRPARTRRTRPGERPGPTKKETDDADDPALFPR